MAAMKRVRYCQLEDGDLFQKDGILYRKTSYRQANIVRLPSRELPTTVILHTFYPEMIVLALGDVDADPDDIFRASCVQG